ncbi:DMT family transporter [Propionivibrio limicola]|uniref:DMT family transporter n=1 Tax=Propionivibrio limicola TaxID=167645 RepID=UPI001FE98734|nr:DMT family transporter [Propionivibrio limicola]
MSGSEQGRNIRGVALFLSALFLFASVDTSAKYLMAFFSAQFLVWARFVVHLVIMLVAVAPRMGREIIVTKRPGLMILRGLMLSGSSLLIQFAFRSLPLAETTAIFFVTPLIVALLAGPILGEKLRLKSWLATVCGFAGVLLIARPGGVMAGAGIAYALAAASCYSLYQILTRKLASTEPAMRQLFYTALIGSIALSIVVPPFWATVMPTPFQALLIVSLGIYGGVGHFFLIRAYRDTPATTLSPMMYVQLVWVSLLGWLVFDHLPDAVSTLGMAIIGVSGLSLAVRWPLRRR